MNIEDYISMKVKEGCQWVNCDLLKCDYQILPPADVYMYDWPWQKNYMKYQMIDKGQVIRG